MSHPAMPALRQPLPPSLCLGIDIGKTRHTVGFLSAALLDHHVRFDRCPTATLHPVRAELDRFCDELARHVPLAECAVLIEHTGHYHRLLEEVLMARGLSVYRISIHQRKAASVDKTDRADALRLANLLYSQAVLGVQEVEPNRRIQPLHAPTPTASALLHLVRRRYELVQDATRHKNKLIAICDEVFPEFTQVLRNPNCPAALTLRERFPSPASVAAASLEALRAARLHHSPGDADLARLQALATTSLGTRHPQRLPGLLLEQAQLIAELRLLGTHLTALNGQIDALVEGSREGQILLSLGILGHIEAATILSTIGTITNFPTAATLKKFCGWAPQSSQTGISFDYVNQTRSGARLLKHTLFLVALRAVGKPTEWKSLYERLVPLKCVYDARTGTYKGKRRVLGRIAGQIIEMIWLFLHRDAELLVGTPTGVLPPDPTLYDREIHAAHRATPSARRPTSEPAAALPLTTDPPVYENQ